jgi:SsrA-binding protein
MPTYTKNKKIHYSYEIQEKLEAGLVLTGAETKAIRSETIRLKGSYVSLLENEAWLVNAHIPHYRYAGNAADYDPERPRKLLLKSKEIAYLQGKSAEKGLTIVPLSVYSSGRHIKLEIGVARGKKIHDKRADLKKRDIERDMRRDLKDRV